MERRGKERGKVQEVINLLTAGEPLPARCRPHQLVGNWYPLWECHIEYDWLLVWDDYGDTITLMHTGTHSDIFGD